MKFLFAVEYVTFCYLVVVLICPSVSAGRCSLITRRRNRLTSRLNQSSANVFGEKEDEMDSGFSEGIIGIPAKNVLGGRLQACCFQPKTGFYRDGFCQTGPEDDGKHTVCVRVDQDFLNFSKAKGNDLSTPYPMYGFPGLKPDDCWCLCAGRWKEAFLEGKAPSVVLSATHEKTLELVTLEQLLIHASGDNTSEDEMQ